MGDRAQLKITNGTESFYLYTHGSGSELPAILHAGLTAGRDLKGDESYALATVLREFVRHNGGLDAETGMGVGFVPGDNDGDYRILTLDARAFTVQGHRGEAIPLDAFIEDPTRIEW